MKHDEAKFVLRARRPGGQDAADPIFAEALAAAGRDAELQAWLKGEEAFDAAVGAKLAQVTPPADLREAILAGGRVSCRTPARWRQPGWLAAAAAVVTLSVVAATLAWRGARTPALEELATFALRDLAEAHDQHAGHPVGLASVQARLGAPGAGVRAVGLNLDELDRARCRAVAIAGREVFELCFQRDGAWFHVYATRGQWRDGERGELTRQRGNLVAAAWSDAANSYALVTNAGAAALRRAL